MTTAPMSRVASCSPRTVTTGMAALRRPCRTKARTGSALRASGADIVLPEHVEDSRADISREDRALDRPERERREDELLDEHRRVGAGRGPPFAGSQRSMTAKTVTSAMPARKAGIATDLRDRRDDHPRAERCRTAASVPSGTATSTAMSIETTTSHRLTWKRSSTRGPISALETYDVPRSKRTRCVAHRHTA